MVHLWQIFRRKFCRKNACSVLPDVILSNLIPVDKRNYLTGTISFVHCCIMLVFDSDGFYENHRQLLSENFYFR